MFLVRGGDVVIEHKVNNSLRLVISPQPEPPDRSKPFAPACYNGATKSMVREDAVREAQPEDALDMIMRAGMLGLPLSVALWRPLPLCCNCLPGTRYGC